MIEGAAYALADSLDQHEREQEYVYPRLARIREIRAQIALAVMRAAQKDVSSSVYYSGDIAVDELFLCRALTKRVPFAKSPMLNY
jgi:malate dehydrogenase (oxaloacetate-decarboxylating)(NADP+)